MFLGDLPDIGLNNSRQGFEELVVELEYEKLFKFLIKCNFKVLSTQARVANILYFRRRL